MFMPGVWFLWSKKKILFQKENGNTIALLIIFLVKSLQKEQKAQIMEYKPQSAGINLQSPQSDSTPWTPTLVMSVRCLKFLLINIHFLQMAVCEMKRAFYPWHESKGPEIIIEKRDWKLQSVNLELNRIMEESLNFYFIRTNICARYALFQSYIL